MTKGTTIAELIELAIETEEAAQRLYRELARKFAHHQDVADFWQRYASAENGHAYRLRHLQGTIDPGRLSAPIDFQVLQDAQRFRRIIAQTEQAVGNLEDAFQLAHEFEHSEVNTVFEVLVTNFAEDHEAGGFLRDQLRKHVAMLTDGFPTEFRDPVVRRAIKALP